MIDVCLAGCGGMMPLPDRFLSTLYARVNGRALLIDCGESTQTAMRVSGLHFVSLDAILFTHYHADHISGLPGLLLSLSNAGREAPLDLYGPAGLERIVRALCVIVPDTPFEMRFHEIDNANRTFEAAQLDITAFPAEHGMPCFGYVLCLERPGRFDTARARAAGVPLELWARLQRGERAGGFAPEDVLGAKRKGLKLVYATDTRPVNAIMDYGADADLMILEGMYGEEDKLTHARQKHHMLMREAAELAARARARALWLTHFSPATPRPEEFLDDINAIFPGVEMGEDGKKLTLRFED